MKPFMERHFQNPKAAREWLERVRWPNGPVFIAEPLISRLYASCKGRLVSLRREGVPEELGTKMERSHIA